MITTVKIDGTDSLAIAIKGFGENEADWFGKAMLDVLALAFSTDDAKEFIDTYTLHLVLELYKAVAEGKEGVL